MKIMFLVSALKTSFLNLIYQTANTVVHLPPLKFSMLRLMLEADFLFFEAAKIFLDS